MKVKVFSLIGERALEGGFFVGNNVPNALAWALDTTDPHFRMSRAILPATITGFYGYGVASAGFNLYILGGGVDIFVGAGAFSAPVSDGTVLAPFAGNPLLPYVVAPAAYTHMARSSAGSSARRAGRTSACAARCRRTSRGPSGCAAAWHGSSAAR